jgi:uncharacterized damage-inducible protein DinB
MNTNSLATLFERDILKLKTEINAYGDPEKLWSISAQINNSGGNLCLHLLGNLQHYIGAGLAGSGYVRNRPAEFTRKDVGIDEMVREIEHTAVLVPQTIRSLSGEDLEKEYPEKVFEQFMTTEYFLMHLLAHLNYHLGQINYHRRLLGAYAPAAN